LRGLLDCSRSLAQFHGLVFPSTFPNTPTFHFYVAPVTLPSRLSLPPPNDFDPPPSLGPLFWQNFFLLLSIGAPFSFRFPSQPFLQTLCPAALVFTFFFYISPLNLFKCFSCFVFFPRIFCSFSPPMKTLPFFMLQLVPVFCQYKLFCPADSPVYSIT